MKPSIGLWSLTLLLAALVAVGTFALFQVGAPLSVAFTYYGLRVQRVLTELKRCDANSGPIYIVVSGRGQEWVFDGRGRRTYYRGLDSPGAGDDFQWRHLQCQSIQHYTPPGMTFIE